MQREWRRNCSTHCTTVSFVPHYSLIHILFLSSPLPVLSLTPPPSLSPLVLSLSLPPPSLPPSLACLAPSLQVGFVGWRGMVGSVLVERMLAEKDFDQEFEATFFTTSNVGGKGPEVGKESPPLVDAFRCA